MRAGCERKGRKSALPAGSRQSGASASVNFKNVFQSQAEFGQGQRRIGLTESSREVIPLPDGQISLDYEILVGLQLTEEQLAYNRRERGF